jgi:ribonuclease E
MVEMTAEEQELYAMMGISPLVLAPDTVKNPKSAVVSVYLPGMAPATAPTLAAPDDDGDSDDDGYSSNRAVALADEDNGWAAAPVTPAPARSLELVEEAEASDASEQNGAPNRRRRRRSSASGSSDD